MTPPRRQFVLWFVTAVVALVAFGLILRLQYSSTQNRWATSVTPKPAEGSAVFREKGCANCHDARVGGGQWPLRQPATLPQLVTAMWNHAPRMYEAMRQAKLPYPTLTYDETGQLVAYLYLAGYSDGPGDAARGRQLFVTQNCARCHSSDGNGGAAPKLREMARVDSPITWTQVLWNHAAAMENEMRRLGMTWPRFQPNELRDLFAYLRKEGGSRRTRLPCRWPIPIADGRFSRRSTASTATRCATRPRWCTSAVPRNAVLDLCWALTANCRLHFRNSAKRC